MKSMEMGPGRIDMEEVVSLLSTGRAYSVFIDDTGTAGLGGKDTVRFVAVVVSPEISPQIPGLMHVGLDALKQGTGATEHHFKDIYHGKGQFDGISLNTRLEIFRAITSVFVDIIKPAVFVQSMDSKTLKEVAKHVRLPELPAPLSLTSPRNFALFGVLGRACDYVAQARSGNEQAVFFCDRGIAKTGYALRIPGWPGIIHRDLVYFVDSKQEPGIQLADFAAFVLNRHQLLAQKQQLSSLDKTFLLTTQPLAQFFLNVDIQSTKIEYDPHWHPAYILQHVLKGTDQNILIIDERTGVVLMLGPDGKDNID